MSKQHEAMDEDALIKSETEWAPHPKSQPNVVAACYIHDTGAKAFDERYMPWCEKHANWWLDLAHEFGYTGWTNEIATLTGKVTYHGWLKTKVGL